MDLLTDRLLQRARHERMPIALFTDVEAPDRFTAGYIKQMDAESVLLIGVTPEGMLDGEKLVLRPMIYQADYDSRYTRRLHFLAMENITAGEGSAAEAELGERLLQTRLRELQGEQKLCSLWFTDAYRMFAYIDEVAGNELLVRVFTQDGEPDGVSAVLTEGITRVTWDGVEEESVLRLMKYSDEEVVG